jgi:hypothetical protein
MLMSNGANRALMLSLALLLGFVPNVSAKMSSEQLQAQITKAKILPPDTKITASTNGAELTVSTYKVDLASENDCKIDAVLIAKTAFDADPELSRATVLFYDPRMPDNYSSVAVTLGDVVAYKAGKVSKEQLLSALKLVAQTSGSGSTATSEIQTPASSTNSNDGPSTQTSSGASSTTTTDSTKTGTTIASITPSTPTGAKTSNNLVSAKTASLAAGRTAFSSYGVTFTYPSQWRPEYPHGFNILVRYVVPLKMVMNLPSAIEMQVYSQDVTPTDVVESDPRDTFQDDWERLWMLGAPEFLKGELQHEMTEWREENAKAQQFYINKGQPTAYKSWKFHRRNEWSKLAGVALPASINIGTNKSIHCLQRAYWITPKLGNRLFARVVAFNHSGCTIVFGIFVPEPDSSTMTAELDDILASVKLSSAPAKKPVAAKKKAK